MWDITKHLSYKHNVIIVSHGIAGPNEQTPLIRLNKPSHRGWGLYRPTLNRLDVVCSPLWEKLTFYIRSTQFTEISLQHLLFQNMISHICSIEFKLPNIMYGIRHFCTKPYNINDRPTPWSYTPLTNQDGTLELFQFIQPHVINGAKSRKLSQTRPKSAFPNALSTKSAKNRKIRINDNNFNGTIPDFIQNWIQLTRLEMHASGLQGPIPSNISVLKNLNQLRISDINGTTQPFPVLDNIKSLRQLVLRNCNISGEIPLIIWRMTNLRVLFLTGNLLSGNISGSFLKDGVTIDLSYNNFTWQSPEQPACDNYNGAKLNLFQVFSKDNSLKGVLPCRTDLKCENYGHSLYVNCGGEKVKVNEDKRSITYEGDIARDDSDAKYYLSADNSNWGFSSSGDFMDDHNELNKDYIITSKSQISETLYNTARISPLSLTYFRYCLQNGSYSVHLHFAEIEFTNDSTYGSLGKRMFDIYAQDELAKKDFNIEDHAKGALKPYTLPFNATVTNNVLEIRFYFAGRGTTRIPQRGVYGPLISAISVDPNFTPPSEGGKTKTAPIIIGVVAACLICLALGIFWWRGNLRTKNGREKDFGGLDVHIGSFTLKQLKAATNNFDSINQIGEGGFGPGLLPDGTAIAVKQLSSKSTQGNREFLNEIGMISCLQHPNLVKLHGCCVKGNQLLLVYEYKENNSLARALLGLAFLHEESRLKIVHRDIKGTNACFLQQSGDIMELVDQKLGSEFNKKEAERMIKVALLCTNASPSLRPNMSEAVSMLEGITTIPDAIPEACSYSEDLRFKAIREYHKRTRSQVSEISKAWIQSTSASAHDLYDINMESYLRSRSTRQHNTEIESHLSEGTQTEMTSKHPWISSSSTSGQDLYSFNLESH
ncbi:hypothetical protein PVL29_013179 [Vitis rotundifolia]|uniref:non-specific serine/threonine protein kinase n=1 Tax=Vitis rotundifolia TaxID=103349 RepID=A0AA39DN93_VITRO|nr:hypothetical protein PVL29_013179 [Vitis rotundifolia]